MVLMRRVALNGVNLDDVDSRICISSLETADGKETINAVDTAAGFGQRITEQRRTTLDIVLTFKLFEHGNSTLGMQARAELLEKVNAWARPGGYLTVNFKPDRRVYVILVQAPGEGSLRDYSKEFQMTFRAYGIPYWEQENARSVITGGSNSYGSGNITVEGSAKTQVNVTLENTSGGTINTASVTVAGKTMNFTGLGMGGSEALVIDHDDNGLLRIRIRSGGGYRSVMACRSSASVDDFIVTPGVCTVSFSAQRACRMISTWRGRYL